MAGIIIRQGENTLQAAASANAAAASANEAEAYSAAAQAGVENFFATIADGVAGTAVDGFFASAESGSTRIYKRTGTSPFYVDQGDAAAPATKALLAASGGAGLVGSNDGASGTLWTTVAGFITRLMSSAGASVIGFIQAGTGAVFRSLQDKLRDVIVIEDFGASVGATAAANAAAIQAALNAAATDLKNLSSRSTGVFQVTGTLSIPAGVQFVGRLFGIRPTLKWSGSEGPTNLSTRSAFVLAGAGSALLGWNISMDTSADFRRTVSMGGFDNQVCANNKINLNLTGVNTSQTHFTIFCSATSLFYNNEISGNEVTGYVNTGVDGLQMSYSVNAKVVNNYIHDLTKGSGTGALSGDKFYWGIYCSQRCYGLLVSGNTVKDTNMSGIHVSNNVDGVANDYGRRVSDNYIDSVKWVGLTLEQLNGAVCTGNVVGNTGYLVGITGSQNLSFTNATVKRLVATTPPVSANQPLIDIIQSSKNITISNVAINNGNDALIGVYVDASNVTISNVVASASAPVALIIASANASNLSVAKVVAEAPVSTASGSRISLSKDNSVVSDCVLACSVSGQTGIRAAGDRNIISNNRLTGGGSGIFLTSASTNSIVTGNIVSGASGVFILNSGTGNSVTNNITV